MNEPVLHHIQEIYLPTSFPSYQRFVVLVPTTSWSTAVKISGGLWWDVQNKQALLRAIWLGFSNGKRNLNFWAASRCWKSPFTSISQPYNHFALILRESFQQNTVSGRQHCFRSFLVAGGFIQLFSSPKEMQFAWGVVVSTSAQNSFTMSLTHVEFSDAPFPYRILHLFLSGPKRKTGGS